MQNSITIQKHPALSNSSNYELLRKKGIEVLLLSDRIDEWLVSHLNEYQGKPLRSIARGDLDLGSINLPAGNYSVFCTVPGHQNMKADLTVK